MLCPNIITSIGRPSGLHKGGPNKAALQFTIASVNQLASSCNIGQAVAPLPNQ
jgi:hypothetical protein